MRRSRSTATLVLLACDGTFYGVEEVRLACEGTHYGVEDVWLACDGTLYGVEDVRRPRHLPRQRPRRALTTATTPTPHSTDRREVIK